MKISLTDNYSVDGFSSVAGFSPVGVFSSVTVSWISKFSVSGLPRSDSGFDKILLKIYSGVSFTLSSSSTFTTYDGIITILSPIIIWPCEIACLAWYGVLK